MAHRARHAVVREQIAVSPCSLDGQMREDLPFRPSACAVARAIGMWQMEHSSWMSAAALG